MIAKHPLAILLFAFCAVSATAQTALEVQPAATAQDKKLFNHLDVSLSAGTTGVGLNLSTPIGNYVKLRAGFEYMPRIEKNINFHIQVGDDPSTSQGKFEKLSDLLSEFSGHEVNDNIDVVGKPTYSNFKLLVDVYPFKSKQIYFTAGFYYGSSQLAEAHNTAEDAPTLFSVSVYNHFYEQINDGYFYDHKFLGIMSLDPEVVMDLQDRFSEYGRMGMHVGDYSHDVYDKNGGRIHQKGDPYLMEPDENSMIKAYARVNRFKPYLGLGYGTDLTKSKSGWGVSFDAGLLFWGGTPSLATHDGTDLIKDLDHVHGRMATCIDMVKAFKVFPVLNLRLTKVIF